MMKQKDESVAALTRGVEFLFRKHKVQWIKGWARLQGEGRVGVALADGGHAQLEARDIVIATGSEPAPLPGVPVDNQRILDSTGALELAEVPRHLVVIGAGVIGLELGSVWRRLGAQVTVLEYLERICPGLDGETARTLQRALTRQGMRFRLGTRVVAARSGEQGVELDLQPLPAALRNRCRRTTCWWPSAGAPIPKDWGWRRSAWPAIVAACWRTRDSAVRRRASG